MKRSTKIAIGAGIGVIALAGIAYAAQEANEHRKMWRQHGPQKIFEQVDANDDKAITLEELKSAVGERFALADKDGNGQVAKADVITAIEENVEHKRITKRSGRIADRLFIGADLDENGELTKEELDNRLTKIYAFADWNDDGKVEMSELRRIRQMVSGKRGERKGWFRNKAE